MPKQKLITVRPIVKCCGLDIPGSAHVARRSRLSLIALISAIGISTGFGRDVLELETRYLGDGCFQYQLRTLYDPFFVDISIGQLAPIGFTNYVSNTVPPHWTNFFFGGQWNGILFDETAPQPRINEISFTVCSSLTSFRKDTNGFFFNLQLTLADCFEFRDLGAGRIFPCLVPCAPEEADGSAPDLVFRQELIPDLKIDELILTNRDVYGLKFSWATTSTVELQGSHDFINWTPVARFFGDAPQTTWTTNSSLNAFGEFFRLRLIADRHDTNALGSVSSQLRR